jgi:hypothetical protein
LKRGQLSRIALQRATHDVETSDADTSKRGGKSRTPPHISVYISFDAIVEFKRLALDLGYLSPHDLYREGLDMVLAKHGRPSLAQIEGKGTT